MLVQYLTTAACPPVDIALSPTQHSTMTGQLAELARLYLTGSNTDSSFTINLWPAAVTGALLFGCEYMIS